MAGVLDVLNKVVPVPGWPLVATTAVFAAAVSTTSFVYLATGDRKLLNGVNVLGTLVHEAGHALVSIVTGGGVYRVEISGAESGMTWYRYRPSPFAQVLTSVAGYAMPPLAGLGAAALLHRGLAPAVLVLTVVTMLLILLVTRDLITLVVVLVVGGIGFAALTWAPGWLQNGIAYAEAWLLLTSEIGGLAALVANRYRRGYHRQADDAAHLAETTPIPAFVWIAAWAALIGWAVWHAAPMLWP